jgi:hypothetical protein
VCIPWQMKIFTKLVLSKVPFPYSFWSKIQIFKHGSMERPNYALEVFRKHLALAKLNTLNGLTVLELGPGDTVSSALVANAFGAKKIYLVDSGNFASKSLEVYSRLSEFLKRNGKPSIKILPGTRFEDILDLTRTYYMTSGLSDLRKIPTESVHFLFSQAVLEHVPLSEFKEVMSELRRIVHPKGVVSHRVDFKDHLASSLNNLRFSAKTWESKLFRTSGFYTNRIRFSEMNNLFFQAGFSVNVLTVDKFEKLPLEKHKLHPSFQHLSEEELCVRGANFLLLPV